MHLLAWIGLYVNIQAYQPSPFDYLLAAARGFRRSIIDIAVIG